MKIIEAEGPEILGMTIEGVAQRLGIWMKVSQVTQVVTFVVLGMREWGGVRRSGWFGARRAFVADTET